MKYVLVKFDTAENAAHWSHALGQVCESAATNQPDVASAFVLNLLIRNIICVALQVDDAEPVNEPTSRINLN